MIPLRVTMSGWMRYREQTTADFTNGRLISICGDNGAGKSSIFDAITFALFGKHRLGRVNTDQLISQGADLLSVSFEFQVGDQSYKVHRSSGHKTQDGTRALYFLDADSQDWQLVPGSEKALALDQQIARIVRLSEAAFTSSFLLQQGEATKFLDAKPQERFQIISSLIGLEAYARLATMAGDAARQAKVIADDRTSSLADAAGIDDAALAALRDHLTSAQQRHEAASAALTQATICAADAATYAAKLAEVAALDHKIAGADELIVRKDDIERDAAAHASAAHDLEVAGHVRDELAAATRAAADATAAEAVAASIDIAALAAASTAAQSAAVEARARQDAAGAALAQATAAERTAAEALARAEAIATARAAVAACDERLAAHDAQLAGLEDAQAARARLAAISESMPLLTHLRTAYETHERLTKDDPAALLARIQAQHQAATADDGTAQAEVIAARTGLQQEQGNHARCETQSAALTRELTGREAAGKEATCSRCGQPVDAKQARVDIADLKQRVALAETVTKEAAAAQKAADAALKAAEKRQQAAQAAVARADADIVRAQTVVEKASDAKTAVVAATTRVLAEAPEEIATPIRSANDAAAVVPLIVAHKNVAAQAKAAQARLDELQHVNGQRDATRREREAAARDLALREAQGAPDVPTTQTAHAAAVTALKTADATAAASAAAARDATGAAEKAAHTQTAATAQLAASERTIAECRERATGHQRAATARAAPLREDLRDMALADPSRVIAHLSTEAERLANAPARLSALRAAIDDRNGWAGERDVKRQDAAAIPSGHRIDPATAVSAKAEAEAALSLSGGHERDAGAAVVVMASKIEHVRELREDLAAAALRHKRFTKLKAMLGPKGLQGALVTGALTSIAAHGNAFLTRLTGGSLQLVLKRSDSGDALELQAKDATCMQTAVDVRALSGSQKFRCAVAVASGIGQYAGAGGMRSIVIDEGFSSLDAGSQLQMVEELKALAEHMDKVIVVSHLEPYKDRDNFPDQLLVETFGESSRIRRIS